MVEFNWLTLNCISGGEGGAMSAGAGAGRSRVGLIFHYPKRLSIKNKEMYKEMRIDQNLDDFFFSCMIYLLYLDNRCFFINALNVKRVLHVFRDSGSRFHVSGPWCLIDLWARSSLGLFK